MVKRIDGEMVEIVKAVADHQAIHIEDLVELLRDSVASGASVGFLENLGVDENGTYWRSVFRDLRPGERVMLLARTEAGRVVGAVQFERSSKPNGRHRAEVMRLLVHTSARGQGLARRLMLEIERQAINAGVSLLVLDTEAGSVADLLYPKLGFVRVGEIPNYACSPDGAFCPTAYYYKQVGTP